MSTLPIGAIFTLSVAAYSAGAFASVATWRKPSLCRYICCSSALAGAVFGGLAAVLGIIQGTPVRWSIPSGIPLFAYSFDYDALAGFFNLTLAILAGAVSLYSFGYLKEFAMLMPFEHRLGLNLRHIVLFYLAIAISALLVVVGALQGSRRRKLGVYSR